MNNNKPIRVRIAPSPTGLFHIGTARTTLFNYLFAKKNNGKFILRIEDTDKERSEGKYKKDILDNLKWLGLEWDEEYCQSERIAIYEKYLKKLLDSGQAFYCYHTKEELDKEKNKQMANKEAPRHICDGRGASSKGIIRFRCPDKKITFNDLIKGELTFDGNLLGDISIAKDEKTPLYNFAASVDDAEMKMSHIIRGEDHISNTPKQIFILEALGLDCPEYAHLPLTLGPDKTKLSKRHGVVSVTRYRKEGYLPEALVNFIAFLGWHPGNEKEIFSLKELEREFSIERINKSNAIFNINKLDWYNGQYIRKMDLDKLTELCLPYLSQETNFDYAKKVVALEQERLKKLSEIGELTKFFFLDKLDYPKELLIWKKMTLKEVKNNLDILGKALSKIDKFDQNSFQGILMPLAEKHGSGELLWPLRVALTGQKASPGPFEIMEVLGKKKVLKRIEEAMELIEI
ncbi:MAG: hypothetical protein AVO34_02120 [Firmicutes bacterium ML8_F2]|jgi:nondiscriminating glutamyl-tRNA synthetase|nr:MAG: hypothetical protein AVO34_02120 [Firmicutes bacterium ML8_F2]